MRNAERGTRSAECGARNAEREAQARATRQPSSVRSRKSSASGGVDSPPFGNGFLSGEGDPATRVVELAVLEHGHEHGEEPVGNPAQGSTVRMAGGP